MRQVLDLSAQDADRMGLALLVQNRNTAVYGGDPRDLTTTTRSAPWTWRRLARAYVFQL